MVKPLLVLLSLSIWAHGVQGEYEVVVDFKSYANPTGRCLQCGGGEPGCCDIASPVPLDEECIIPERCDTALSYCWREVRASGLCPNDDQQLGPRVEANSREADFEELFFGLENPVVLKGNEPWQGAQLLLIFHECSQLLRPPFTCIVDPLDLVVIDTIAMDITAAVGTSIPQTNFSGMANISHVTVTSIEVRCADGFYGPDCSTECSNFVNCTGCGLPGFTGRFCETADNCAGVECSNGECVSQVGGFRCQCATGFTGDFCESAVACVGCDCGSAPAGSSCQESSTAEIAAGTIVGVLGTVAIITAIVVVIVVLGRRRNKKNRGQERESKVTTLPGDNPAYGTGLLTHYTREYQEGPIFSSNGSAQDAAGYQVIPAHSSAHTHQLVTDNSAQEREFKNPIYGSDVEEKENAGREFDNPIYGADDSAGQEMKFEALYTVPDLPDSLPPDLPDSLPPDLLNSLPPDLPNSPPPDLPESPPLDLLDSSSHDYDSVPD